MLDVEEREGCETMWGAQGQPDEKSKAPQEGARPLTTAPGGTDRPLPPPAWQAVGTRHMAARGSFLL